MLMSSEKRERERDEKCGKKVRFVHTGGANSLCGAFGDVPADVRVALTAPCLVSRTLLNCGLRKGRRASYAIPGGARYETLAE